MRNIAIVIIFKIFSVFSFQFHFVQKEFDTFKIFILQTNVQNSFIMCIFQFVQKISFIETNHAHRGRMFQHRC